MPGGNRGQDGVDQERPADGGQAAQATTQARQEAGQPILGNVAHPGHGLLGGLGHALGAVEQAHHPDDQPEALPCSSEPPWPGLNSEPMTGNWCRVCTIPVPRDAAADLAEHGYHHQQERIDRREPVPAEGHDQQVGVVVAELLDDPVGDGRVRWRRCHLSMAPITP